METRKINNSQRSNWTGKYSSTNQQEWKHFVQYSGQVGETSESLRLRSKAKLGAKNTLDIYEKSLDEQTRRLYTDEKNQ